MSTWTIELCEERRKNKDDSRMERCSLGYEAMDRAADFHSHSPRVAPRTDFMAWTRNFVYFAEEYDGAVSCTSVPRNPPNE